MLFNEQIARNFGHVDGQMYFGSPTNRQLQSTFRKDLELL